MESASPDTPSFETLSTNSSWNTEKTVLYPALTSRTLRPACKSLKENVLPPQQKPANKARNSTESRNSGKFMAYEGPLPCSQHSDVGAYPQPCEFISHYVILLSKIHLIIILYLCLDLPGSLFLSNLFTKIFYKFLFSPKRATCVPPYLDFSL